MNNDAKFVRCSECRALNEPRAIFCSRCGASLYGPTHGGRTRSGRRFTATSFAIGTALLLGLIILAFILYTIVDRTLDTSEDIIPYADQTGIPATTSTTQPETSGETQTSGQGGTPTETEPTDQNTTTTLAPLAVRPKAAVASSALEATSTASYQATNLLDGDLTTAWLEGMDGPGLGEWVRFEFSQPVVLARLEIANGYQKDDDRFLGNPRVKLVKVEYSSGTSQLVDFWDTRDLQAIKPTDEAVEWVKLVIVSVYPGSEWEDTALSEVHIYEEPE